MNPDPTSLDRVHDLVPMAPAPWWPPTPGWAIVLGLLTAAVLIFLLKAFLRWQADRYRREALALLADPTTPMHAWPALLKRAALTAWPREEVAALTGPAWWRFLDLTAPGGEFEAKTGALLERAAWDLPTAEATTLSAAIRQWLRHHHRASGPAPRS